MSYFVEAEERIPVMYRFCRESGQEEIYTLLHDLGLVGEHTYFFHTAYALRLALKNPQRLCCVTKWLYPEVACHYDTTTAAVERNLRIAASLAWERSPRLLERMAGRPLKRCPASRFLAILADHLNKNRAA